MNFRSALNLTSSAAILGSSLLLSGCGESNNSNSNEAFIPQKNQGVKGNSETIQSDGLRLSFNGFSENGVFYDQNPLNLAGDLSAVDPANLYLHDTFIKNVGTIEKPPLGVSSNYQRLLPASKTSRPTGLTLLDPNLALNGTSSAAQSAKHKMTPSIQNPVYLSIPAGLPERPEAPFFPAGTRYTAIVIESPTTTRENHGAYVSIESGIPLQFAALAHHQDKIFNLRIYDKASTTDKSGSRVLLTPAGNPATIQSRFLVLAADGLANENVSLTSMLRTDLPSFGVNNGKALLQSLPRVFPQLVDSKNQPIFNNGDHGVFCLGGNNTFANVDLNDQTFIYPISPITNTTIVRTLNVSDNSGFITESGKHITVDTLNGKGTLKLIAVLKGAVSADPIVHVKTLNGVNTVNVVVGTVDPAVALPSTGMTLLSFDNNTFSPLTVNTIDAHMAGAFYDGESEIQGNKVVLKTLTKKTGVALNTVALRSLANHPSTQGISSQAMHCLIAMLDPLASVQTSLGHTSASLSQHALGLQLNAPYSTNQSIARLSNNVSVSASHSLENTVTSINLSSKFAGLDLITSVYGVTGSAQNDKTFGSSMTALKSFDVHGMTLIPSMTFGYSMDILTDKTFSANGINLQLADARINSAFARAMTAFHRNYNGLSATLAMGLEARHAMFNSGRAFTAYDSVPLAGEHTNGLYSVIEASFATNSTRLNIALNNVNHAQIQFGFND